jgi:hypothetical protein
VHPEIFFSIEMWVQFNVFYNRLAAPASADAE